MVISGGEVTFWQSTAGALPGGTSYLLLNAKFSHFKQILSIESNVSVKLSINTNGPSSHSNASPSSSAYRDDCKVLERDQKGVKKQEDGDIFPYWREPGHWP